MPAQHNELLTHPPELKKPPVRMLTGNEYISLPEISLGNGGIISLNLLNYNFQGLIEFCGTSRTPLLFPFLKLFNAPVSLDGKLIWSYHHNWIPQFNFSCSRKGVFLQGTITTPPGHKGFVYSLYLVNQNPSPIELEWGWKGLWSAAYFTVFTRKSFNAGFSSFHQPWTNSLILEINSLPPAGALAFSPNAAHQWRSNLETNHSFLSDCPPSTVSFYWKKYEFLGSGESTQIQLFTGANLEGDGAGTTVVDLKRRGSLQLYHQTANWLKEREYCLSEASLQKTFLRNLFFSYFYSQGKTIDRDNLVLLTSRSPRYYVSAAFWSRDSLLWSFPAILLADPPTGRKILLAAFRHHAEKAGEHAHYLGGSVLYPGFELDQLASYFLALRRYLNTQEEDQLVKDQNIQEGLTCLARQADRWFDPKIGLYATFLDPSDDPVEPYPFLIYNNALLQQSFAFLGELQSRELWENQQDYQEKSRWLKEAIYQGGVVNGPMGPMFAWSVNQKGNYLLYDNPPGSLQLLPHYGFCSFQDPVYLNTVRWIYSTHNPYYHQGRGIKGTGSFHAVQPWPLSAANDLLALNFLGGELFKKAFMDGGFCCETINPLTGKAATGLAFASAAGFIAYGIWKKFSQDQP